MIDVSGVEGPVEFVTKYDGEALREHIMPVRDLAPALLALGQAFDRANTVLNANLTKLDLAIRATSEGSFEFTLVVQQVVEGVQQVLTPEVISTGAAIKRFLFGDAGVLESSGYVMAHAIGLMQVIKWHRGRKATREEKNPDGTITLTIGNETLTIPSKVWELYADTQLRRRLEAVVKPLTQPGIDTLEFREGEKVLERVVKADVPFFSQRNADLSVPTETLIPQQRLQVGMPNLLDESERKWTMSDGGDARQYAVTDTDFLGEVVRGERSFRAGDILVCDVLMRQWEDKQGKLKSEYEVARVLEHVSGPRQIRFEAAPDPPRLTSS